MQDLKICCYCKIEQPITEFYSNKNPKGDGYQSGCKECQKVNARARISRQLETNRQYLNCLKSAPCEMCGQSYPPECMDFDHINPSTKLFDPSGGFWKCMAKEKLDAEISKCRLLCCYCHADISHQQRSNNKKNNKNKGSEKHIAKKRAVIAEIKENNPCSMCGVYFEYWKMQFDHLDAYTKIDAVSNLVARYPLKVALEEIKKCQLLCIGCHRLITKLRASNK